MEMGAEEEMCWWWEGQRRGRRWTRRGGRPAGDERRSFMSGRPCLFIDYHTYP